MRKTVVRYILLCLFAVFARLSFTASAYTVPPRMQWWADSRFGMFIHFGSYSEHARGEWAFSNENWSKAAYQTQISAAFDPVNFDATAIATAAKNAGMKYLVITSKHHEGFAMWQSNVASFKDTTGTKKYNLFDYTVFKRDILMELKNACAAQGIKFCLYYSILDWNHPSQTIRKTDTVYSTMSSMTARANYITDMKAHLSELITKYDPAILWFDGDWCANRTTPTLADWWNNTDGQDLYNYLLALSPNVIINERVKRGFGLGDFTCPEQTVPSGPLSRSWETNATMNGAWGYNASRENSYRSTKSIIEEMVTVVSREGNYLLNIGPKGDGSMTGGSKTILTGMGTWMAMYSDSIYGTTRSPFSSDPSWGKCTKKSGKLYAQVFTWPTNGQLHVPTLANTINRIYTLNNPGASLSYSIGGGNINISVPTTAPDANVSVVVIEVLGVPVAGSTPPPLPPSSPSGLTASAVSSSQIDLAWTAGTGATSYDVKRANVSGGPYTTVRSGVNAVSFNDTGLASSTTYNYVVTAVNGSGESGNSNQASATTPSGGGGGPIPDGTYKIINRNSGLALDVANNGTASGSNVDQATYTAANNQRWTVTNVGGGVYSIIGVGSGKSLDVTANSTADGANIEIWASNGGNNQRWTFTATSGGYYTITSVHSGKLLDVVALSNNSGANVDQWTSNGGTNQQWILQAP